MSESKALAKIDENAPQPQALMTAVERDRMVRQAASAIAGQTWGKGLSQHEQAAVARYAMEAGLDPVRHINVLGGNVYVNAQAYMDTLAATDGYEGVDFVNITEDKDARKQWAVPDRAKAVYVCTVRVTGRTFTECGYAPKHAKDQVGEQYPGEKARATALRRAARMAVPVWTTRVEKVMGKFEVLYADARAELPPPREVPNQRIAMPADPYSNEPVPVTEIAPREPGADDEPDPYGGDPNLFEN